MPRFPDEGTWPPAAAKLGPTFSGLRRGYSAPPIVMHDRFTVVSVFPSRATRKWSSESASKTLAGGRAYQVVFMGTTRANMKLKFYAWPNA